MTKRKSKKMSFSLRSFALTCFDAATMISSRDAVLLSFLNYLKSAANLFGRFNLNFQRRRRRYSPMLPFLVVLWARCCSNSVIGFAAHHKQHRSSSALYAWNNFTELQTAAAVLEKGSAADFNTQSSLALLQGSRTECPPTTSSHCLRCTADGCIKCPLYLITDTRQCVDLCPAGYIDQWSAHTEFMGRVCISTGYSGAMMAALAGLLGGFLVCLSLLAVAVMLVKRRRHRKLFKQQLFGDKIGGSGRERNDFLRQLNELRPNAEYFLAMLNDSRRQIRKLYLSGEVAAANSYRPLVRDLAKLLILLNRPIELIPAVPPRDWQRLHAWAEQALERYRPQVVDQLIDFFQTSSLDDTETPSPMMAHFGGKSGGKSAAAASMRSSNDLRAIEEAQTTAHKLQLFGSLISLHEFEEPRPSDPFGSSFNTLKGALISDLNASSLWLEDEFYKLGFRPQDVITTEL